MNAHPRFVSSPSEAKQYSFSGGDALHTPILDHPFFLDFCALGITVANSRIGG